MYVYSMYNSVSMQHRYIAVATYSVYVHTVLGKHALSLHSTCMYILCKLSISQYSYHHCRPYCVYFVVDLVVACRVDEWVAVWRGMIKVVDDIRASLY